MLSPLDVLKKGSQLLGFRMLQWTERRTEEFCKLHYGSSPVVTLGDLMTTDIDTGLTEKTSLTMAGMHLIARTFGRIQEFENTGFSIRICERNIGEPLWRWVRMIAALKAKIVG
jgi:hypothetical protein